MYTQIDYRTMDQQATDRAIELFRRGDRYRASGQRDFGSNCDAKALRHLEHSYLLRNITKYRPFHLVSSAWGPRH